MDKLLAEIRHCTVCVPYLPFGPRPVVQLNPQARILIAAQAPGRKVHETGIPFNDASGIRLRDWLRRNPWFEEEVLPPLRQRVEEILSTPNLRD